LIRNVYNLIDAGCIPGASFRNLEFVDEHLLPSTNLDYNLKMIAFDAQTSGGLLMSISPDISDAVLTDLHSAGLTSAASIGEVTEFQGKYLLLNN
jgi:selenide,water dikinase